MRATKLLHCRHRKGSLRCIIIIMNLGNYESTLSQIFAYHLFIIYYKINMHLNYRVSATVNVI